MSRTIEIRGLTDAQCDALKTEADAQGIKFYELCRLKLLAGIASFRQYDGGKPVERLPPVPTYGRAPAMVDLPIVRAENQSVAAEIKEGDRMDRLEAMMARLGETVMQLAGGAGALPREMPEQGEEVEIDLNDVVQNSLTEADRQGYAVEREAPLVAGGVRHVGARRPMPLTAGTVPRHLQNL